MRKTRVKWALTALAVLLNLLGSPMAWAQLNAPAADMQTCHGHDAPAPGHTAPDSMPCCDGGGCTCAAPALFVFPAAQPARVSHSPFIAPVDTSAIPAHPLDDTLRPPIR